MIDQQLLLVSQVFQVEAQGTDVLDQLLGGFLEGDKETRFVELCRPTDKELHSEESFPATGTPTDKRRAAARQAAAGHFVQPFDTRARLGERSLRCGCKRRQSLAPRFHSPNPWAVGFQHRVLPPSAPPPSSPFSPAA